MNERETERDRDRRSAKVEVRKKVKSPEPRMLKTKANAIDAPQVKQCAVDVALCLGIDKSHVELSE